MDKLNIATKGALSLVFIIAFAAVVLYILNNNLSSKELGLDGRVLIYAFVFLIGGIALFYFGFKWLREKLLIESIPTSKIRSLAMGIVEVFGEVIPAEDKLLRSPFTNKDCVYYEYSIQERRGSGKNSRWVTIRHDKNFYHFFVEDETGEVLVDPDGANIDIPFTFTYNSGLFKDPPKEVQNFLKSEGLSFEGFFGINKTMKFEEKALVPNKKVYIMGEAGDNPFVEEATSQKGVKDVMIQKGKNEKFFYISTKPEKEVLKGMGLKAYVGIALGILFIVGSLIVIFAFFNFL
ncbi:MAG: hypothetical protein QT03_C0001G0772 [archaeon GW2011_AR10]|uniref:RING-type E3 ubiquitin transferase n=1 Tax=Candidatus Iainarchaeum sp. TaxID=3101447 RepID=A0A7J4IU46_9ARCH|nr:MAG: hypothetical protein QT03_C0001G0772 [archaeon GW2011_AR10]HIH08952.1 hypothetical protein [Candidatus Diapherotrites archaeon]